MTAPENQYVARLREAVTALREVRAQRDALLAAADEPIAVIGLGCRFPGADDPDAYWQVMARGIDAVGEIPASRWPAEAIPGERPEVRWAGLLDSVDGMDAAFFGISPREAESLDPQQRLLLEVAWEALENAGQRVDRLAGSPVGVFLGLYALDYQHRLLLGAPERFDAYCTTGNLLSTAAGRLSYVLGFQGPAVSMDTACSSSLVSISLACQSLRARECDVALAGGVHLVLSPLTMAMLAETQALSPDGRCKTFDARANGFVRGEGCGLVVLKRLSDAQRDGDRIRALIRGWAVNQDGRSTGLTAPNVLSQQALLRRALAQSRVSADAIGYVEMHGTGTPLGDPIEADALREVLGQPRDDGSSCVLGAVKTNIGHLEAAAGVAGLIKAVLVLEHEEIPKNLHFRRLNPRISFEGTPLVIPTESLPWKRGEKPRLAGVSSFGLSGTNAHIILEEAPLVPPAERPGVAASSYLLPLSAKSPQALSALARAHANHLASLDDDAQIADVTYTASVRRTHHEHRLAVAGRTRDEIARVLLAFADGEAPPGVARGRVPARESPKVFVFSGQGAQWVGMGQQLLAEEPVFAAKLGECDALLRRHVSWSLLDELRAPEERSRLGETEIVQPALFAIQVGLAAVLKSWGVTPDAVIGHSVGEVAAAHVAGALSLEEAVRLVAWRGRIMQRATGLGKMTWVGLPQAEAEKAIAGREDVLAIAAVNDPGSVVLSGETAALEAVVATLSARGIECRALKVNYAFHSPQMEALARELVGALGRVEAQRGTIPLYSTVTGTALDGDALDAAYWGKNVRDQVQFARAVDAAFGDGHRLYLEVGPHPVLSTNLAQCLAGRPEEGHVAFTLRRQKDEPTAMLHALGSLYARGHDVDFAVLHPSGGQCVSLPAYPWQRERHWIELTQGQGARRGPMAASGAHPLLGASFVPVSHPEAHYWERWLSTAEVPYLTDHRVRGDVVFPGAGYVEMALAAATEVFGAGVFVLESLSFERMLTLTDGAERQVQCALVEQAGEQGVFEISSRDAGSREWTRHMRVAVRDRTEEQEESTLEPPDRVQERCATVVEGAAHYARMEARQLQYGPVFRGVERIWVGAGEALGRVELPKQAGDPGAYQVHPGLLDACFQVVTALFDAGEADATFVPADIGRLRLHGRPPRAVWVRATLSSPGIGGGSSVTVNLSVIDEKGRPWLEITELRLQRLARSAALDPFAGCAFTIAWHRKDLAAPRMSTAPTSQGAWLVFEDEGGRGAGVVGQLRERGEACIEVVIGQRFERKGPQRFAIDPSKPEDYQRLFREVVSGKAALRGVVHFWSLDSAAWGSTTTDTLLADVRRASVSVLLLVQEIVWQGLRDAPRLVLVTRGAQMVQGDATLASVSQAPLWGLGRTIVMEQPDLACTRVDLDPIRLADEPTLLVRELLQGDGEDQIALRAEGRLVARLEQGDLAPTEAPAFSADASYVITGGLGGLGLSVARWMASSGARHLVLVGRSEPNDDAREAIRAMEQSGAEVYAWRADVSRTADVEGLLLRMKESLPPLRGIVHAAAVLEDRTLQEMGEDLFWRPIRPKVLGAWNLHAATRSMPLDFFVMYSSLAALLGSPGQGNYAAANAFMDALAHRRVALGLPATSIQWGPFSEVGLAAAQQSRGTRFALHGVESFTPEEGTALLARRIVAPTAEVGLARLSMRQLIDFYPRLVSAPFFESLRAAEARAGLLPRGEARFREALAAMPSGERPAALERHVIEHLGRVLGMSAERLDAHSPFRTHGVDSLMSLEMKNRLELSLGLRLSSALLYTYPTVASLVEHLLLEMQLIADLGPEAGDASRGDDWSDVSDLSEEAAAAMLDERLLDLEDYLK